MGTVVGDIRFLREKNGIFCILVISTSTPKTSWLPTEVTSTAGSLVLSFIRVSFKSLWNICNFINWIFGKLMKTVSSMWNNSYFFICVLLISGCNTVRSLLCTLYAKTGNRGIVCFLCSLFRLEALDKHSKQVKHHWLISKMLYTSVKSFLIPEITMACFILPYSFISNLTLGFEKCFTYKFYFFVPWKECVILKSCLLSAKKKTEITFLLLSFMLDIDMECLQIIMFIFCV